MLQIEGKRSSRDCDEKNIVGSAKIGTHARDICATLQLVLNIITLSISEQQWQFRPKEKGNTTVMEEQVLQQQIATALRTARRPLQPVALVAAVFPDGATEEQEVELRLVANEMINMGELIWISGAGYYLVPSA